MGRAIFEDLVLCGNVDQHADVRLDRRCRAALCAMAKVCFTNPLMRAQDPHRLGQLCLQMRERAKGLKLVIDTTIATPWAFETPLLDIPGVDVVSPWTGSDDAPTGGPVGRRPSGTSARDALVDASETVSATPTLGGRTARAACHHIRLNQASIRIVVA